MYLSQINKLLKLCGPFGFDVIYDGNVIIFSKELSVLVLVPGVNEYILDDGSIYCINDIYDLLYLLCLLGVIDGNDYSYLLFRTELLFKESGYVYYRVAKRLPGFFVKEFCLEEICSGETFIYKSEEGAMLPMFDYEDCNGANALTFELDDFDGKYQDGNMERYLKDFFCGNIAKGLAVITGYDEDFLIKRLSFFWRD